MNGKNVAVYGERDNDEMRQLRLETTGGKCLNVVNISKEQYVKLREEWEDSISFPTDARITQRALKYMGMNEFKNG